MYIRGRFATRSILSSVAATMLAGCAATPLGPSVQVMPGRGKTFDAFQSDSATCKTYAAGQIKGQVDASNQRAVGGALFGTVLGAGTGAALGGLGGNAGGGAAAGAALGAGAGTAIGSANSANDQLGIQAQYDNAFSQCMYSKGNQVPGSVPVQTAIYAPGPVAVPDPLVRATQSELIRLGYLQGSADGFSGPKTRAAIAGYEQSNGLPVDGSSSPGLLAKLQATPSSSVAAPAAWVTPAGTSAAAPAPSSNWVAPAETSVAPASTPATTSSWVAPTKSP